MTRQQKQAWYELLVCITALAALTALALFVGLLKAWPVLGLLGLLGVGPLLFARRRSGASDWDERELQIFLRANNAGLVTFWAFFVAVCMAPLLESGGSGQLPVQVLPLVLLGGVLVLYLSRAVSMLLQYRGGGHGED